ncbi:ATP-binding protein [Roseospira visakhapatnamensis]|uniref:histidine kinase n=1 Tax=Roseospira visakhapatnamensis TaxID=390880 RepID=A0A7W6W8W9_9PROT|nr:ATP-binding protein [Roseospira visakhapatnamensis]MBB4265294.1 PAS domain S-box-containing protein [Roseospira visakhapatnamensis]
MTCPVSAPGSGDAPAEAARASAPPGEHCPFSPSAHTSGADPPRRCEQQMRAAIDAALDCIIAVDAEGRIVDFNPAAEETFGYRRDEVLGRIMSGLIIPPALRAAHDAGMERLRRTGVSRVVGQRLDLEAMRANGEVFPCELAISATDTQTDPVYVAYLRDISDRVESEQALKEALARAEEASRVKSRFLAMMSHEIRTPLNGVLGVLGLLEDSPLTPEQYHWVRTGVDSATGLLDIINDILDFSKIEAGQMRLEAEDFSLVTLIDGALDLMRPRTIGKDITLVRDMSAALPGAMTGDAGRLRQILLNLLSNALKFTETGVITVTAAPLADAPSDESWVRLTVSDTGRGIPQDRQSELFQEFVCLDTGLDRTTGGTGLGLVICRRLAEMMGGRIHFESEHGSGSRFHVDLPLPAAQAMPMDGARTATGTATLAPPDTATGAAAAAAAERRGKPIRILLAEDNQTNAMVAKAMIGKAGYRIDTVANGAEAVQAARTLPYDLILMDVSMPVMDGLEATRRIRDLPGRKARIPIVAMTAHAMRDEREAFWQAGMNDCLPKPTTRDHVLGVIRQWTSLRSWDQLHEDTPTDAPATAEHAAAPAAPYDDTPALDVQVLARLAQETGTDLLPHLTEVFADNVLTLTHGLIDAITASDATALERVAHSLASSAGTFGAMTLHRQARHVETLCMEGDTSTAFQAATQIQEESERLLTELPQAVAAIQADDVAATGTA